MGGFLRSAVVSTAAVGVPPTESLIRPQPTNNSEMHGVLGDGAHSGRA